MQRFLTLVLALMLLVAALAPQAEAGFCNTQGYPYCETFDGTPCGPLNPSYQRCVAPGVCEWGACSCDGTQYNCFW
jgi:hypothetical protein